MTARSGSPNSARDFEFFLRKQIVMRLSCAMRSLEPQHTGEISMSDFALPGSIEPARRRGPDLDGGFHPFAGIVFMGVMAAAVLFSAYSIYADVDATGAKI